MQYKEHRKLKKKKKKKILSLRLENKKTEGI